MVRFKLLIAAVAGLLFLVGCETMPMPDMSKFNLDLLKDKPEISIKSSYSKVNIRPTPSTNQAPVATVRGGDRLQLLGEEGSWLNVGFFDTAGKEQVGWVYKFLVDGYPDPPSPSTSSANSGAWSDEGSGESESGLQVEKDSGNQDIPKSESVSPL